MTTTTDTVRVSERLDALPFTRRHARILGGSGLVGPGCHGRGLISFVIAALSVQWQLAPTQASWIASAGFAGMAIGASLGGLLADRFGRRHVFALTLLVYGVATGARAPWSAVSPPCSCCGSWWAWVSARNCPWRRPT